MARTDVSAQRRRTILSTARRCFIEQGFHATRLEDIHRLGGVSIGSIYHHFGSKERLACAVFLEGLATAQRALLLDLGRSHSARSGIEGLVRCDLRQLVTPDVWSRYTFPADAAWLDVAAAAQSAELEQEFTTALAAWLAPYIADGSLLPLTTAFYLLLLFGPAHDFADGWLRGRREPSLADAQDVLAQAAWAALRQPTADATSGSVVTE